MDFLSLVLISAGLGAAVAALVVMLLDRHRAADGIRDHARSSRRRPVDTWPNGPRHAIRTLTCATVLVAGAAYPADSPEPSSAKRFSLHIVPTIVSINRASSSVEPTLPEDWEARFEPPTADLSASAKTSLYGLGMLDGLALEASWRLGARSELSLLVSHDSLWHGDPYGATGLGYRARGITADWWNPVPIVALRVKIPMPSIGMGMRLRGWGFSMKLHRYELREQQFEGVDCQGCANTARLIEERTLTTGWGQRYGLDYHVVNGLLRIGVSYERNGTTTSSVELGTALRFRLPL